MATLLSLLGPLVHCLENIPRLQDAAVSLAQSADYIFTSGYAGAAECAPFLSWELGAVNSSSCRSLRCRDGRSCWHSDSCLYW